MSRRAVSVSAIATLIQVAIALAASASELRDPTRPPQFVARAAEDPTQTAPRLSAIVIGDDGRVAVIDDQRVREGERVGNARIEAIEPTRVRLTGPRGAFALELLETSTRPSTAATRAAPAAPANREEGSP